MRRELLRAALGCTLCVASVRALACLNGNGHRAPLDGSSPALTKPTSGPARQPTSHSASQPASRAASQPGSAGNELKDAVEIFRRADAATFAVKSIRYEAQFRTQGPAAARSPTVIGRVLLSGKAVNGLAQARIACTVEKGRLLKKETAEVGTDGTLFFLIDATARKIHADNTSAVLGPVGTDALYLVLREFGRTTPFADEIGAARCELMGHAEISGVPCYELRVSYDDKGRQATWLIGKADFLPRRVVRILRAGDKQIGSTELILEKMEVEPKIEGTPFTAPTLEGFERVKTPHGVK